MDDQVRQGDVFVEALRPGGRIPEHATPVPRDQGRLVLAYGERTGHSHAIEEADAVLLEADTQRYLRVTAPVTLRHQPEMPGGHNPIALPPGEYRVVVQREYHPDEIRSVRD